MCQGSPLLLGPFTRVSVRLPVCPFPIPPHPQWLRPYTLLTVSDDIQIIETSLSSSTNPRWLPMVASSKVLNVGYVNCHRRRRRRRRLNRAFVTPPLASQGSVTSFWTLMFPRAEHTVFHYFRL